MPGIALPAMKWLLRKREPFLVCKADAFSLPHGLLIQVHGADLLLATLKLT
jgi:hypothetical protein